MDVGVIGGADGPTSIIVASSNPRDWITAALVALAIGAGVFFLFRWIRSKGRKPK